MIAKHYTYRTFWSAKDAEFVAKCAEFPSLSWLDKDENDAFKGIKQLVRETIDDLSEAGENASGALAD